MIHKQGKTAAAFVSPEEEIDIEEELLEHMEDDPEGIFNALAKKIDAIEYMKQRSAEIVQGLQEIEAATKALPGYEELMRAKQELKAEEADIRKETTVVLEEILLLQIMKNVLIIGIKVLQ